MTKSINVEKGYNKAKDMAIMTILITAVFFLIGYLYYREQQFVQVAQNQYSQSFYDLVSYTENVETMLAKTMASNSNEYTAQNLVNVWREANLAQNALSKIPININMLEDTNNYLNQVSDYSYSLSRACMSGERLTQEQKDNLAEIYSYSTKLKQQLIDVADELESGTFTWDSITRTGNKMFNQDYEGVKVEFVDNVNNDLQSYAGLIYDGAFSNHIMQQEPKGLKDKEYTQEEAEQLIKNFVNEQEIKQIQFNGLQSGTIEVYNFNIVLNGDNNEENYMSISITKKGGQVLYLEYDREYGQPTIQLEEAKKIGEEYLAKIGYENMRPTYHMNEGNSIIVNYAYYIDDTIYYPDLIKLKIALDNGQVVGIEANGYLYNHHKRNDDKELLTIEQARQNVNPNIQIQTQQKAIIPTDWKTEVLCYEFKGTINDKTVLVYINAETGKEENIFILVDDINGTLTI